jgi:hypothetical protein
MTNPRLKYLQYKGKTIFYVDFRNMTIKDHQEAIALLDDEAKEMSTWADKGLVLNDFRGGKASPEFMSYAKKLGKEVFAVRTLKSACIGITGIQNILLQAYNTFTKNKIVPFDTEEEAKEWLVND